MTQPSFEEALAGLDPEVLAAMTNVRAALRAQGLPAAESFRQTLVRAQQICRQYRESASPDHARALEEIEDGIVAAGEILEVVCLSVVH
jgi:hypothetical protein